MAWHGMATRNGFWNFAWFRHLAHLTILWCVSGPVHQQCRGASAQLCQPQPLLVALHSADLQPACLATVAFGDFWGLYMSDSWNLRLSQWSPLDVPQTIYVTECLQEKLASKRQTSATIAWTSQWINWSIATVLLAWRGRGYIYSTKQYIMMVNLFPIHPTKNRDTVETVAKYCN